MSRHAFLATELAGAAALPARGVIVRLPRKGATCSFSEFCRSGGDDIYLAAELAEHSARYRDRAASVAEQEGLWPKKLNLPQARAVATSENLPIQSLTGTLWTEHRRQGFDHKFSLCRKRL